MLHQSDAYRSTQVTSTNPAGQIVLLYEGAIRFSLRHLAALERGEAEAAHNTSLRAQAIVSALQETLDLSAGPIAEQLDSLYDFVLQRLAEGNVTKTPGPTGDALQVLRGLLEAWQEIARKPASGNGPGPAVRPATAFAGAVSGSYSYAGGTLR